MAKPLQVDGATKNPKPGSGWKPPHGRISSAKSADTGRQTTSLYHWVWTLLLSSSYVRLSRLNIAKAIHNTLLRPPMLQHWLKQFRGPRSFLIGGCTESNASPPPRLKSERLPVCGAISICLPRVVRIVHLRSCAKSPPNWWLHMRSRMTPFSTFVRSADALCKLRCVCPWTYYNDTSRIAKTPGCRSGAG